MIQPILDAVLLGIVRGSTEFFPLSTDGHLALSSLLFGQGSHPATWSVSFHVAALAVILVSLRRQLVSAVRGDGSAWLGRDLTAVLLGSLPTLALGLLFREAAETARTSPLVVGLGFVGTSGWLLSTRWVEPGRQQTLSWLGALVVGFSQGLAVFPGLSRGAGALACALWLGLRPSRAFDLSLLMALPAFVLGIALEAPRLVAEPIAWDQLLVGLTLFSLSGWAALQALRLLVQQGRLWLFAAWTVPLSLATLSLSLAWPS